MLNKGNDLTGFVERRAKLMIEKRAILTLFNILRKFRISNSLVFQITDLMGVAMNDFDKLLYDSGEDPDFI